MKNGVAYEINFCLAPELHFTRQRLKKQITEAMSCLSMQSRWQRFAAPVHELSDAQLDYLTNLDGKDRLAWCAVVVHDADYRGIGLSRYSRLPDKPEVAEFAVTVVDEFQGQGVGQALLERLMDSARENQIETLTGSVMLGNRRMLRLCRRLKASITQDGACLSVRIPIPELTSGGPGATSIIEEKIGACRFD